MAATGNKRVCPICGRRYTGRRCPPCKGMTPPWGTPGHDRWMKGILKQLRLRLEERGLGGVELVMQAIRWALAGERPTDGRVAAFVDAYPRTWLWHREERAIAEQAAREFCAAEREPLPPISLGRRPGLAELGALLRRLPSSSAG